jgi:quercetin dioxygenase-like cupin family protein
MTAPHTSFSRFEAAARAAGCTEVTERHWRPHTVLDTHTHPFAVQAQLTQGELWLTRAKGEVQHLVPGDTFTLARDEPHAERYGAEGGAYWVGRR